MIAKSIPCGASAFEKPRTGELIQYRFTRATRPRPGSDMEGEELHNAETARHEATLIAGELFKDIGSSDSAKNGR
jgi:hypothetical protein